MASSGRSAAHALVHAPSVPSPSLHVQPYRVLRLHKAPWETGSDRPVCSIRSLRLDRFHLNCTLDDLISTTYEEHLVANTFFGVSEPRLFLYGGVAGLELKLRKSLTRESRNPIKDICKAQHIIAGREGLPAVQNFLLSSRLDWASVSRVIGHRQRATATTGQP